MSRHKNVEKYLKEEYKPKKVIRGTTLEESLPIIYTYWDKDKNKGRPQEYTYGSKKDIWLICEEGHSFITKPHYLKRGQWCTVCAGPYRFSNDDVDNYFLNNAIPIKRMSNYTESGDKNLRWECISCDHIWTTTFNNIKTKGSGCPKCNLKGAPKKELSEVDSILKGRDIERLESYINAQTRSKWKCIKCEHEWVTTFSSIYNMNTGCPMCNGGVQHSNEDVDTFLKENNIPIIRIGQYKNARDNNLLWECMLCGLVWRTAYNGIKYGRSICPICQSSKGERRIREFLNLNEIDYEHQVTFEGCKNKNVLPFDFGILSKEGDVKLLIEFDGIQHFEPVEHFGGVENFEKVKVNDQIKNLFCKNNNIPLVRIPYTEYENIEFILKKAVDELNEGIENTGEE